jgi:hypothetical protein
MAVYIVMLRQPDYDDPRDDPFWEFGSFGCTGCHSRNLLAPGSSVLRNGDRLAFAQGGDRGTRLVLLTPPISIARHQYGLEALWDRRVRPFHYAAAPVLVGNEVTSDIPGIARYVSACARPTPESKFASKFRGRTRPLEPKLAAELVTVFGRFRSRAGSAAIAKTYTQAMPWFLAEPDTNRWRTYQELRRDMGASACPRRCAPRSCRS